MKLSLYLVKQPSNSSGKSSTLVLGIATVFTLAMSSDNAVNTSVDFQNVSGGVGARMSFSFDTPRHCQASNN